MIHAFISALALVATLQPCDAPAQTPWPAKPVKLVVAGAAGSGTDITARIFTDALAKALGQPFVIENRAGANGMIGTEAVAKAPNDGYTFLFTYAAAHVVNPVMVEKLPYDATRDFTPVVQIGAGGNLLVVPPSMPVKDLREFIAYAKSRPAGELAYGSWGNGSGGHLSMEALNQKAGLTLRHIPYKSSAAANTDLIGGQLQAAFTAVASGLPLIQAGKMKPIAVSGTYRVPQLPEVRTMTEQGVPFDINAWYAIFAPAGTPAAIVNRLNREVNRIMAAPEMAESLKRIGLAHMPIMTPEQFGESVLRDMKEWGAIVRAGNIKAD